MPRCYALLLCNTRSKNAGWGVLVPGFIEVVIYSFRIGSLGAFSPSKNTSWAYHFNACRPIFWLNQYPLQIKELLVPPLEVTANVGRHWQERANAPPVTSSYEIHQKQRLCFASRSIPEGGWGKKSTTKHIRSQAALPNLPRLEFRRSLLIPRSRRRPREQIQHDDTKA